ncbi:LamG domain-containing protein [Phycisphaeraceae bacterium D3-23]
MYAKSICSRERVASSRREAGAAMLLVVIALAVAAILALSFMRSSGPTMAVASNIDRQAKVRAVAEAGLEFAIEYVKENDNWRATQPNGLWLADQPLNGGTFSVYGTDDDGDLNDDAGDTLNLSVVAKVDGVTHRVSARVDSGTESLKLKVMFVVRNSGSLTAEETRKQSLFESWGYTVSILDDGAGQTAFDTAAAESEVAFISSDASYGTVGSKLRTHPLGVVYELAQMSYYFDIATNGGLASGTQIDIVDNTHYITAPFSTGVLTVADSSITLHRNRTNVASGANRIAEPTYNDDYALLTVETGAALLNSNTAPARRVKLPWTGDTSNLNDDGRLLTRRALEWASANEGGAVAQLIVHYEFDQVMILPSIIAHWQLEETEGGGGGLAVGDTLTLNDQANVDSYDSRLAAYGGTNISNYGTVSTNSDDASKIILTHTATISGDAYVGTSADLNTAYSVASGALIDGSRDRLTSDVGLPSMTPPLGLLPSVGDITLALGIVPLILDTRYQDLTLSGDATLSVVGDIVIRVDGTLTIEDTAKIVVPEGSTLTLWVAQGIALRDAGQLNGSSTAADRATIYVHSGGGDLEMADTSSAAGTFYVSDELNMSGAAELFGSVMAGDDALLSGASQVHIDKSLPELIDEDTPVRDIEKANHGSFRGDPAGGQPGATPLAGSGFSMYFDGSGDFLEMPHISAYELDGGTFSCWFKADTTSGRQGLFSKDSTNYDTGGHFSVFIESGKVRVRMQSTTTSYWVESGTVSTNTWYHIMFAWGAEGMVLYLDGIAVDTNSYTGGLSSTSGGTGNFEPIVLGGNAWQSDDLLATPVKDHFHGFIDDLRIYDERLNAQQAIDLFNGIEPGGQLSETLVEDTSGFEDPLNLAIADPEDVTWSAGTLTFDASTVAESLGDATKVYDAIMATGEFSIAARFSRASPGGATGPARIVSMSSSTGSRNFTLGQESTAMDVRVRTSTTGSNGILSPNYETGSILTDDDYVYVVVAYDGEALKTFVDGTLVKSELLGGTMTSWSAAMPLLLGNEVGGSRPWLGTLDEVSIYDRALSVSQSDALASGEGIVAQDPKAVWVEQD